LTALFIEHIVNECKRLLLMTEEEARIAGWTVEEHLAFDIGFALPRAPVRGLRRALRADERRTIARAVVDHLKLAGWKFEMGKPVIGYGAGRGGSE
jgi:hypothetical protein